MADHFDLGKLLENVPDLGTKREQIEYIRLDLIDDDAKNFYATDEIESLARNIATVGLLDPLRIRDDPDSEGRYKVVSGHRRRLALNLLVHDDPERWGEVACIHDQMAFSPTMQQLRLIFANSDNRNKSNADISEEAVQTEQLLYKLAEEEGYEFPGRMRDHVAKIVGVSKSKLARLKVIRKGLAAAWRPAWESGTLPENTAYELSKMPKAYQSLLFEEKTRTKAKIENLYADDVKKFAERADAIVKQTCSIFGGDCGNYENKMRKAAVADRFYGVPCDCECCRDCRELLRCQKACPRLKETIKQLKADAKDAAKTESEARQERDNLIAERISALWQRFGLARELAYKDFSDCKKAMGGGYYPYLDDTVMRLECGEANATKDTLPPYYPVSLAAVNLLSNLADFLGCSIDYLFCRTDVREIATEVAPEQDTQIKEPEYIPGAWYPVSVEPPVGVPLILIDSGGYADTGKYRGCGEYTMDYGDPVTLWTLEPKETDVVANTPVPELGTGWQTRTPEAYGTYVAYVQITGSDKKSLRELLWDGEEWFLFGQSIADTAKVCCWMERPEDV